MDTTLLKKIADAQAAGQPFYVSQAEGLPLVQNNPPLIVVDGTKSDPNDNTKIAAQVTADGAKLLTAPPVAAGNGATHAASTAFTVQSGFVPPKIKRGGGFGAGAPTKYPFETMDVGGFFFVANTDVSKGDAMKTLSSAVGSANERFKEDTGQTETKTRAKRGKDHKTVKDETGKNVMETVTLPVRKSTRKFGVRAVEAGKVYGQFTAPSNGAVAYRVE